MSALHEALSLEQVIARICNGEPLGWLIVQDGDKVYEIAVDLTEQLARKQQGAP